MTSEARSDTKKRNLLKLRAAEERHVARPGGEQTLALLRESWTPAPGKTWNGFVLLRVAAVAPATKGRVVFLAERL